MQQRSKHMGMLRTLVLLHLAGQAASMPMYVWYFGTLLHSSVRLMKQLH
jgi:hypothetical protein